VVVVGASVVGGAAVVVGTSVVVVMTVVDVGGMVVVVVDVDGMVVELIVVGVAGGGESSDEVVDAALALGVGLPRSRLFTRTTTPTTTAPTIASADTPSRT
jgi:hypothetical protein